MILTILTGLTNCSHQLQESSLRTSWICIETEKYRLGSIHFRYVLRVSLWQHIKACTSPKAALDIHLALPPRLGKEVAGGFIKVFDASGGQHGGAAAGCGPCLEILQPFEGWLALAPRDLGCKQTRNIVSTLGAPGKIAREVNRQEASGLSLWQGFED